MGSEENHSTAHKKISATLSEMDNSQEEDKKEKEITSMSHRNLVKIESLKLGIPYQNELKGDKKDGIGPQGLKKGNNNDEKLKNKNGEKGSKDQEKTVKAKIENQNDQNIGGNDAIKENNIKEENIINENDSVNLQNENDTKKFDEFLKNRGNYRKKKKKTSLFENIKLMKEKLKNKLNDQQLVQIVNIVKEKPKVKSWTIDDVKNLFIKINLEKYIPNIEKNAIDGKKFLFLENQSISNIFNITDKNEIRIISVLIEFIGDISNNEQEKNKLDNDDNNININNINNNNIIIINAKENKDKININNKKDKNEGNKITNIKFNDYLPKQKHEIEEEKNSDDFYLLSGKVQEKEKENNEQNIKGNANKGKSEFYQSLNSNSLNFYINYDEIKKEEEKQIGKGGMGELYLGEWQGKQIAIKKIKLDYIKNNVLSNKFINEINIIASMRHPNILLYMGVTIDNNNNYYMITEYLPQGSLHEYLHPPKKTKKIPLTDKQKIKIALQIAIAIQYIHSRKILHCDLKSANILIDKNFNIKLSDFGLSYFMSDPPTGFLGTARWVAPEILKGGKYDIKADIFSYGMIVMELLTEKIPYSDIVKSEVGKDRDIIKEYVNDKIENGEDILPIPKTGNKVLRYIVANCLQARPENRMNMGQIIKYLSKANKCYEDVDEVTDDIFHFLS
jgi:tRNA A-37 threonylcarbamoyl transferase component Bud32